jgi:hypothetical protein
VREARRDELAILRRDLVLGRIEEVLAVEPVETSVHPLPGVEDGDVQLDLLGRNADRRTA